MENQNNHNLQEIQSNEEITIESSEKSSILDANQIDIISEKTVEEQPESNQIINTNTNENPNQQSISDDQISSQSNQIKQSISQIATGETGPGKVGLDNIGNTCFFNSGLQCVSHVMDLVSYFISNKWTTDLNVENPRGMKGELASAFAKIIQTMWSDNIQSFNPTEFKDMMGKYAPQFSGNEQEDAHEFITFLLDGLHEDLNRTKQIQSTQSIIGNGTDDIAVSKQTWDNYKLNHDSIINDLFQGLLRSELNCPKCKKTTTVFDPFLSLSLPLVPPSIHADMEKKQLKQLKITYVPRDFYAKYKVFTIDIDGTENTFDICRIIREKTRTSLDVMIGRIDPMTHDISWGLVNENKKQKKKKKKKPTNKKYQDYFDFNTDNDDNDENVDDDSGEYHAFEYEITEYPMYWIPCYLIMQVNFSEQIVGGPFLLAAMEEQPDEFEISHICEKDIFFPKWEEDFSDVKDDTDVSNQNGDVVLPEYNFSNGLKVQVSFTDQLIYDEQFPYFANNFLISRLSKKAFDELKIENILINNELANLKCAFANDNIPNLNLQDCLDYFAMRETLDYKNMWYCPHCKQKVNADKKLDIWKSPKYLILHLKRFIVLDTPFGRTTYKIFKKVSYPFTFDFQKYIIGGDKQTNYQLIGVIEHFGSLENGHYTALALVDENYNRKSDEQLFKWYNFNDGVVHKSSRKDIISSDAYILFYERIDE